jgi:hypothetical protein
MTHCQKWSRWYSCVLRIDCFLPWISFGLCLLHVFRCHASPLVAWPLVAWYILIWFETCHGYQLLFFPNVLIAQYVLLDQAERPFVTSSYATSWALTTHWWPSYSFAVCCIFFANLPCWWSNTEKVFQEFVHLMSMFTTVMRLQRGSATRETVIAGWYIQFKMSLCLHPSFVVVSFVFY